LLCVPGVWQPSACASRNSALCVWATGEMIMLTIYLCVGSSCYVRGSEQVAQILQNAIAAHDLQGQVDIVGTFCLESCSMGVTLRIGEQVFDGICPEEAQAFFEREVLPRVDGTGGSQ